MFAIVLTSAQKSPAEPNYPATLHQEEAACHVKAMWQCFRANGGCQSLQPSAGNITLLMVLSPQNPSHSY